MSHKTMRTLKMGAGAFLILEGLWSILFKEQVTPTLVKPATLGRVIRIAIGVCVILWVV